jgi:response regulator RpfG family c-di-GMP phosphodiesterase
MITKYPHFVIVDDDPINNFITKRMIVKVIPNAEVVDFTESEKGLDYVLSLFEKPNEGNVILVLDINMPNITGWQFMVRLELEGVLESERLFIYILSSSVDRADREKANNNPHIIDYIIKPLTAEVALSFA